MVPSKKRTAAAQPPTSSLRRCSISCQGRAVGVHSRWQIALWQHCSNSSVEEWSSAWSTETCRWFLYWAGHGEPQQSTWLDATIDAMCHSMIPMWWWTLRPPVLIDVFSLKEAVSAMIDAHSIDHCVRCNRCDLAWVWFNRYAMQFNLIDGIQFDWSTTFDAINTVFCAKDWSSCGASTWPLWTNWRLRAAWPLQSCFTWWRSDENAWRRVMMHVSLRRLGSLWQKWETSWSTWTLMTNCKYLLPYFNQFSLHLLNSQYITFFCTLNRAGKELGRLFTRQPEPTETEAPLSTDCKCHFYCNFCFCSINSTHTILLSFHHWIEETESCIFHYWKSIIRPLESMFIFIGTGST